MKTSETIFSDQVCSCINPSAGGGSCSITSGFSCSNQLLTHTHTHGIAFLRCLFFHLDRARPIRRFVITVVLLLHVCFTACEGAPGFEIALAALYLSAPDSSPTLVSRWRFQREQTILKAKIHNSKAAAEILLFLLLIYTLLSLFTTVYSVGISDIRLVFKKAKTLLQWAGNGFGPFYRSTSSCDCG